jgi:hypothetical protein
MGNNMHNTLSLKGVILFYENLWNKGKIRTEGPAFQRMVKLKEEYRKKILKSI